jgi:hypothetical protein
MTYYYQRDLSRAELMRAAGIGLGLGAGVGAGVALVGFYVTRIFMQRTPLREPQPALAEPGVDGGLDISIVRKA